MGLRGPGAKPNPKKKKRSALPVRKLRRSGASRFDRVVQFIESLPITSGLHAGKPFILRPWQAAGLRRAELEDALDQARAEQERRHA
jgi:hypothetical protein